MLLLVPSVVRPASMEHALRDSSPTMDYAALQQALNADVLDYSSLARHAIMRRARSPLAKDVALAWLGCRRSGSYDAIFSNGENVGIPLAALLTRRRRRPGHVVIGHRLSPAKKRPLMRGLRAQMDTVFVYSSRQRDVAVKQVGIPAERVSLIPFHADHRFFRPIKSSADAPCRMVCSAGLEWRDYPTLIAALGGQNMCVRIAAASPWSKHRNETEKRELPPNISARPYCYSELRQLYADARIVVVPLYENDFQAGITTILEAMAMGKALVVTRTTGQQDTIVDGVNGVYVPPGDAAALRRTVVRLLDNPDEASRLGRNARRDIESGKTLDHWVERVSTAVRNCR